MGYGWTHNLETRLIFSGDPGGESGVVKFKAHSANLYRFNILPSGTYQAYPGVLASLLKNPGPPITYTLTTKDKIIYQFDEEGRLLFIQDEKSNQKSYTYDVSGLLQHVEGPGGNRFLELAYDAGGLLTSVTDHSSRALSFGYDANGDLVSITDVLGEVWTYSYDAQHHLLEVVDPDLNTVVENAYDAQGRVTHQYDGLGNLVANLVYATGNTKVYDAAGNWTTYYFDSRSGAVIKTVDDLGNSEYTVQTPTFRPMQIFDETNEVTQLAWSLDGANLLNVIDAEGNEVDLGYDSNNHLTSYIDPRGYLTTYSYQGNLLSGVVDALNGATTYTYTAQGLLETETDPLANVTTYDYDANGQLISMTDALLNTWTYAYDSLGRLVDTTDPLGRVTHNAYDAAGRITRVIRNYDLARPQNDLNLYNIYTDYAYDTRGNLLSQTDTLGNVTTYTYDDAGRLLTTADPTGAVTTNSYNALGQLVSTTDALLRVTTYTYDDAGRLTGASGPLGWSTSTAYNPNGTVASTTDALGRVTSYTYDGVGRNIATTFPDGSQSTNQYDQAGNLVSTTDSLGRITSYTYDALGRLISEEAADGGITQHFYDANSNRIQTIDPLGNATTFGYDNLNRLVTITDALGNVTTYAYNALGNRTSITDANGNQTQFVYDALNRLVSTQNALNGTTSITYDALGRRTSVTDELGRSTDYTYDDLGRVLSVTDSINGITSYTYDLVGNQLTVQDQNSHTTSTAYDTLNRPVVVMDPNANETTTAYDLVGNAVSVTDDLGHSTGYAYNSLNRLTSITNPLGNLTRFAYDNVGNRVSMTDANNITTRYQYDALNQLTAVFENYKPGYSTTVDRNVKTQYTYDENGNRLSIINGRGKVTTFAYDDLNRLIAETDPLSNTLSYSYDDVGNLASTTNPDGALIQYSYDALNRLTLIDYPAPDADTTFAYDAAGQRTSMQDGVGATTWTYDNAGRPVAINDPFGNEVSYGYDAVGNRTLLEYPDGKAVSYTYDAANRLVDVFDWSSLTTHYNYDGANQLTNTSLPNSVSIAYSYDTAGRITGITSSLGANQLASYEYAYDGVGNRVTAIETYLQPSDLVFADDFESGDLSKWSASQTGLGNLAVSANAAIRGSFGLEIVLDNAGTVFVQDDTPNEETNYRARFYFSPNSISAEGDSIGIFTINSTLAGTIGQVLVREESSQLQLQIKVKDPLGNWTSSDWAPISRASQSVEIEWHSASAEGQADGSMKLWIEDQEATSLDAIANFGHLVDKAYLGAGLEDPVAAETTGIMYFDAFESRRNSHIGIIPNLSPGAIFADEFESGDLSAWSASVSPNGELAASEAAALKGAFGLQAMLDNANTQYVQDDTPNNETHYRARFYVNPGQANAEGDILGIFTLHAQNGTEVASLQLRQDGGATQLRIAALEDNLAYRYSGWLDVSDFWQAVELEWSASDGSNSGTFTLWVDGQPELQLLFLDNDTFAVDYVRLGAGLGEGIDANSSGKIYFDAFVSRRITYIGVDPDIVIDELFADGFEDGNLSVWSDAATGNGALSVSGAFSFEGDYSLRILPAGVQTVYVQDNSPGSLNRYRARFYIDPQLLNNEGDPIGLLGLYTNADVLHALVVLRKVSGQFEVGIKAMDDAGGWQESWAPITDAQHAFEIDWRAAANGGAFTLWVDGAISAQVTGIDNDTLNVDYVRLGAGLGETIAAGTDGALYLDLFVSRVNSYIGYNPDLLTSGIEPDYIQGLKVWLDASQITGMADGSPIGTWTDLSGSGQNAVQSTGVSQPVYRANEVNGLPAIDFDGVNDFMRMANLNIGSNTSIFIVAENSAQTTNAESSVRPLLAGDNNPYQASGTEYGLAYRRSGVDGFNAALANGSTYQEMVVSHAPTGLYEVHALIKSNTSATLYRDFYPVVSGTFSRTSGFGTGYYLGAETSLASRYFRGGIAEIFVYDHALTALEKEKLEDYLAEKYQVQAAQATPTPPAPSGPPLQVSGLKLWLDAAQIYAGYNGQQIGTWQDMSGNGQHATQGDTAKWPIYTTNEVNGQPALIFDGSNDVLNIPNLQIPSNTTIFIVAENSAQTTNTASIHRPLIAGDNNPYQNSGTEYGLGYKRSGADGFNTLLANGTAMQELNTTNAPTGLYEVHMFTKNGTSALLLRNFVQVASGMFSRTTGLGTGYRIAAETSNTARYFLGGIAEIIVYDHALTAEEQSILEGYLSQKYGISLPATPTPTETPTPSATSTPTPSETPTASDTPTPSNTPLATDTPLPSDTPTPSETFTPEPTLTPSETPTPTDTPSGGGFIDPSYGLAFVGKLNSEVASAVFRLPGLSTGPSPLPSRLQDEVEEVTRTIQYTYDGLHRLISAEYDDGNFFDYTYDSVGNRLSETTAFTNTIYAYDAANRLTSVNGVPYSWDANGNLLSDGLNTYTYDHANRLVSVADGTNSYAFAYNGLGDRLQQTVNTVTTNYTLDLNAGLTQVLSDGSSTYLYGVGRIGAQATDWAYHLPDALGSVRQLADATGAVSYAQSFEPYGESLGAFGGKGSSYGFTGEWTDGTGLMYLRARYYAPTVGSFISRDVWPGALDNPHTLNKYLYVLANPVVWNDPTGLVPVDALHIMIQTHFAETYGQGHLVIPEFLVQGGSKQGLSFFGSLPLFAKLVGTPTGNPGFIDIVDVTTGEAFEIKNVEDSLLAAGEINWYISTYNELPNPKEPPMLRLGTNYGLGWEVIGTNPYFPGSAILARLSSPGVIAYKSVFKNRIPVTVPRFVWEWDPSTNSAKRQEAKNTGGWVTNPSPASSIVNACMVVIITTISVLIIIDPSPDDFALPLIWSFAP